MIFIKKLERERELKKEVLEEIFKINTYWENKVECSETVEGAFYDLQTDKYFKILKYYNEKDAPKRAYLVNQTVINNAGLSKMVRKQESIYRGIVDNEEIQAYCIHIILNAISKFKLKENAIKGKEKNLIYAYILKCVDKQIQNYIDKEIGTYKVQEGNKVDIITPQKMMSYDLYISDDANNDDTFKDFLANEQNLFYRHEEYKQTETYKQIYKLIESKLNDNQKQLLHLLAYTIDSDNLAGNNAEVGRILKELDIKEGRETRSSDDAYRVYVSRQIKRIVKIIESSINVSNINKTVEIEQLKEEIENLLDDVTEQNILIYVRENIDNYHIDKIVYNLDVETRKYLIHNFINKFEDEKLKDKQTRKVCRLIVSALYKYLEQLKEQIKNINVIDLTGRAIKKKPYNPKSQNSKIKYYVFKNKFDKLKEKKDITILDQKEIKVEYTRRYEDYRVEYYDCYLLGEFKAEEKKTVQNYNNRINQVGLISKI